MPASTYCEFLGTGALSTWCSRAGRGEKLGLVEVAIGDAWKARKLLGERADVADHVLRGDALDVEGAVV